MINSETDLFFAIGGAVLHFLWQGTVIGLSFIFTNPMNLNFGIKPTPIMQQKNSMDWAIAPAEVRGDGPPSKWFARSLRDVLGYGKHAVNNQLIAVGALCVFTQELLMLVDHFINN